MSSPDSDSFVRAFARGLRVIEVMGQASGHCTIAQIAQASELPRTVVRRLLFTLAELGFVKTDERSYWLTPKVLRLGLTYLYTLPFWRQSQLVLEELGTRLGQSCAIAVLDEAEIVYVQRFHTKRILAMSPSTGTRLPAYAVSMGRVLLAGLEDSALEIRLGTFPPQRYTARTITDIVRLRREILTVRKRGYCWVDGELDESICGLAVPVRDTQGTVVAALNVSLLSGEFNQEQAVATFLPLLKLAASRLKSGPNSHLGGLGP